MDQTDDKTKARALETYLVASVRLGDRQAVAQLVLLRGPRLYSHAMRLLGQADEARDVVQEAWIDILRGLKGLREEAAFPAWATRIVSRKAARLIARKQADRQTTAALAAEPAPPAQPNAQDLEAHDLVRLAITGLPAGQSAAIALFYLEDMSVAEVATALDIPPGTVKTRLMHARRKLRETLKEVYDDQT